jgi:acyl transferase domain-containing protein/acyl carrier protein
MSRAHKSAETIRRWLVAALSARLNVAEGDLDLDVPIAAYGLGSRDAVELSGELEEWLGTAVSPTVAYEHPTIRELCAFLANAGPTQAVLDRSHDRAASAAEPIAVVGLACRFPGAADGDAFWSLLRDGIDAVSDVPPDRWNGAVYGDGDPSSPGGIASPAGGFLSEIDRFDAQLFNIAPREARSMDPQQRLLLETSWEALEHAGIAPDRLVGSRTGVFFGASGHDYADLHMRFGTSEEVDAYLGTGNAGAVAAGRVSYVLGLHGPSLVVDTACSSSLVAVHLAVGSLRARDCELALAGGVNVLLSPEASIGFTKAHMLSPRGRCRTFDASADGYVRGEGCGVVVLRRLSDAQRRGERVLAAIRGTAVNHDGRSAGLTAPNGTAQTDVVRMAWRDGAVSKDAIGYIEAHGTGTMLGDPIEVRALGDALGRDRPTPCAIGSVKSNIGHLEAAAGIAGLIKVVLSLQRHEIPASLHVDSPNPLIPWDTVPVFVPRATTPWAAISGRRLAGVSSFGFSGTNAHVVVEEAPEAPTDTAESDERTQILRLSARTPDALSASMDRWSSHLERMAPQDFGHACFSGNVGRAEFGHRLAVLGNGAADMAAALRAVQNRAPSPDVFVGHARGDRAAHIAFLFTGQGSQYVGMGRALDEWSPVFREALDRCERILEPLIDRPLRSLLYSDDDHGLTLAQTAYAQPALFSVEYALAALWQSWGIKPCAVLGHSLGEWTAACVVGMIDLEDALTAVAARGRLMQAQSASGKMAAVDLAESQLAPILAPYDGDVVVAAINAPAEVVISGRRAAVDDVIGSLTRRGVHSKELSVSHAFHSPLMDPMLDPFWSVVSGVRFREPAVALFSSVTGRLLDAGDATRPEYWRDQVRHPVRYAEAVRALTSAADQDIDACVEIGPGTALLGLGRACVASEPLRWVPSITRARDEVRQMLESLAVLYTAGAEVDWTAVGTAHRRLISVPTYPFQREPHWMPAADRARRGLRSPGTAARESDAHPFLTTHVRSPRLPDQVFETSVTAVAPSYMEDHRVGGQVVFPASAYVEMAAAAAMKQAAALQDLRFTRPLVLNAEPHVLQVIVAADGGLEIVSRVGGRESEWHSHFEARCAPPEGMAVRAIEESALASWSSRSPQDLYDELNRRGLEYGAAFQTIERVWFSGTEVVARVRLPQDLDDSSTAYHLHPALLDGCFQAIAAVASAGGALTDESTYVPAGLDWFEVVGSHGGPLLVHAKLRESDAVQAESFTADLLVWDEDGAPVAVARGFRVRAVPRARLSALLGRDHTDAYIHRAEWQLAGAAIASDKNGAAGRWVIVATPEGLGDAIVGELAARGTPADVIRETWTTADRWPALESALSRGPIGGVAILADLPAMDADTAPSGPDESQRLLTLALRVAQTIAAVEGGQPRLCVVTRGAQAIGEEPCVAGLFQAPLWGFVRGLALEHAELRPTAIDCDRHASVDDVRRLVSELLTPAGEDEVALRPAGRFVRRLVRQSPLPSRPAPTVRRDGTYLVTGGTGALGLVVAEWLASRGAGRLVLVARRAPSPAVLERASRMREDGTEVVFERADVGRRQDLVELLARVQNDPRALRGIVHAAGLLNPSLVSRMTVPQLTDVLTPKIAGAWHLHLLTRDEPLDWFVLFSSFAALAPEPGQANYAAANAFLDAVAAYRAAHKQTAVSINWGPWADGLGAESTVSGAQERIQAAAGVHLLERILSSGLSNVAAMPLAWGSRGADLYARLPLFNAIRPATARARRPPGRIRDEWRRSEPNRQDLLVEEYLREEVGRILRLEPTTLDAAAPLATFGLDSLTGMELRDHITTDLDVTVPMTTFVQGPSVRELARAIGALLVSAEADRSGSAVTLDHPDGSHDLLARVDELSEGEIDSLLTNLMSESNRLNPGEHP